MPNRNGTGPEGKGPKTGRTLGTCGDGQPRGGGRVQSSAGGMRRRAPQNTNESRDKENK